MNREEAQGRGDGTGAGGEVRPPGAVFGGLAWLTLGFSIAAGAVLLVRLMKSESDGMRVLYYGLAVLVPLVVLVLVGWVVRRRSGRRGGVSKVAAGVCGLVGLASGAALWVAVPTDAGMAEKLIEETRGLILERAGQLAACRDMAEAIPAGSLAEKITEEQLAELKGLAMDFAHSDLDLSGTWNALVTADTDYARLKVDTDPDSIMEPWDRPTSKFYRPSDFRYSYDLKGKVDDIADLAYGDASMGSEKLAQLVAELKQLKYVVIVRMVGANLPLLTGDEFQNGYVEGEALCFELEGGRMVGGFVFGATNSEKVAYNYAKNAQVTEKADSAGQALEEDLEKNAWVAFWHRLHEVAEGAKSPWSREELPYKTVTLKEAMLIMKERKRMDAEREKAVEEKLQGGGTPGTEVPPAAVIALDAGQEAEVRRLLSEEGLIAAIKRVREITGRGLAESKAYVESLGAPR